MLSYRKQVNGADHTFEMCDKKTDRPEMNFRQFRGATLQLPAAKTVNFVLLLLTSNRQGFKLGLYSSDRKDGPEQIQHIV